MSRKRDSNRRRTYALKVWPAELLGSARSMRPHRWPMCFSQTRSRTTSDNITTRFSAAVNGAELE